MRSDDTNRQDEQPRTPQQRDEQQQQVRDLQAKRPAEDDKVKGGDARSEFIDEL